MNAQANRLGNQISTLWLGRLKSMRSPSLLHFPFSFCGQVWTSWDAREPSTTAVPRVQTIALAYLTRDPASRRLWFDERRLVLNFPNSLVGFAPGQQFLMPPGVHHLALFHYQNPLRPQNRRGPVRDHQQRVRAAE